MKKTKVNLKKTEKSEPKKERKKRIYKFSQFRTKQKPKEDLESNSVEGLYMMRMYLRKIDLDE